MNKLSLPMLVTPETLRSLMLPLAWRKILQGLQQRKLTPLGVRCAETTLDHFDPAPKPLIQATITGPIILTWSSESPSPTPLARSSESSMTPGADNGHERVSLAVTDDLENL